MALPWYGGSSTSPRAIEFSTTCAAPSSRCGSLGVTRLGGRLFVADQLGSIDPLRSMEMDRFERLRDASHQRLLPDGDIRGYLDANDLVLLASEVTPERVDLERRLDLAGLPEGDRVKIRGPAAAAPYEVEIGWYVSRKPGPS